MEIVNKYAYKITIYHKVIYRTVKAIETDHKINDFWLFCNKFVWEKFGSN
jgi:hypothetical protein